MILILKWLNLHEWFLWKNVIYELKMIFVETELFTVCFCSYLCSVLLYIWPMQGPMLRSIVNIKSQHLEIFLCTGYRVPSLKKGAQRSAQAHYLYLRTRTDALCAEKNAGRCSTTLYLPTVKFKVYPRHRHRHRRDAKVGTNVFDRAVLLLRNCLAAGHHIKVQIKPLFF